MIEILVIGRHPEILATVLKLINKHPNWHSLGAIKDVDAIDLAKKQTFDLVLLGGGILDVEEVKLKENLLKIQPNLTIIQHFGGGSGLLCNEIQMALDSLENKSRNK
jgi:chemotaxis response regulator CheB